MAHPLDVIYVGMHFARAAVHCKHSPTICRRRATEPHKALHALSTQRRQRKLTTTLPRYNLKSVAIISKTTTEQPNGSIISSVDAVSIQHEFGIFRRTSRRSSL